MDKIRHITWTEYGVTHLHWLAIAFLVFMAALAFSRKPSNAVLALLAACVFAHFDQRIVIAGMDFSILRLITLLVWIRVLIKGEYRGLSFGKLDRVFFLWVISASLFYVLRVGPSGIVYRLGLSFDALGVYFLIRVLVRRPVDVLSLWRQLGWIVLLLGPFVIREAVTGQNVFGIFSYSGSTEAGVRDGQVRAQGPFSHAILAGTFGSAATAVFVGLFLGRKKERLLFGTAALFGTAITIASSSSGPLMAWLFGALGWSMWWVRGRMRLILWGTFGLAVVIHFAREMPLWHLIGRLASATGGTGYHRYRLIDAFVNRFWEWALVGTDRTAHWGWGLQDTTCQYVREGVSGGLVTLVLFIVVLRSGFVRLRLSRITFERLGGPTNSWALLAWGCSVSLAVHCVSFISISYFGRMQSFLSLFLATIPALATVKGRKGLTAPAARLHRPPPTPAPASSLGQRS